MRSFAAVLTRRLLFRPLPSNLDPSQTNRSIYDHLSESTRKNMETVLLLCLREETDESVRRKVVDTVTDIAMGSMERGRLSTNTLTVYYLTLMANPYVGPWPELQSIALECTQSSVIGHRESAFRIFSAVPHILLDHDVPFVCEILERGLKDTQSVEVRRLFFLVRQNK